jgi:diguanylate cyclase (GGDEF)-like protein
MRKQSNIGSAMLYLGIFNILLGIWSLSENGIVAILVKNRAANSTVSFLSLALIGMPFIMFVRCYLQTVDKYIYRILVGLNSLNVILMILLQIFGIRDMKETLWLAHIAIIASFLYLPVSLVHMIHNHMITHRFWVTVFSLACMFPPLAYSLYLYYYTSNNISSYGNIFLFLFVTIFAVDVTQSIKKDVDAGKKSAIYQELAEKDLLTDCYNRNAYRNDTGNWANLQGVLLITCDLNNLKQCNDTLGHAYGDQYITDAAAILKKVFSKYGKVYRIGGDEFCIIIPDGHKCNIEKLLEMLADEQRIYNETSEVINLQIACGYAVFDNKTDSDMEDIRNRADERMYNNKKEIKLRLAQMSMR